MKRAVAELWSDPASPEVKVILLDFPRGLVPRVEGVRQGNDPTEYIIDMVYEPAPLHDDWSER